MVEEIDRSTPIGRLRGWIADDGDEYSREVFSKVYRLDLDGVTHAVAANNHSLIALEAGAAALAGLEEAPDRIADVARLSGTFAGAFDLKVFGEWLGPVEWLGTDEEEGQTTCERCTTRRRFIYGQPMNANVVARAVGYAHGMTQFELRGEASWYDLAPLKFGALIIGDGWRCMLTQIPTDKANYIGRFDPAWPRDAELIAPDALRTEPAHA